MYKIDVPIDYKESAAIERRRQQEEERKARIFNARVRQIGVDEEVLSQQIRDKKQMQDAEKRRQQAFDAEAVRNDKIAQLMDRRLEEDKRRMNFALNEFRLQHQTAECRREFDLYDPQALKKDQPARVSDDGSKYGPSCAQMFMGEDLNGELRRKQQIEQLRHWTEQQARERKQSEENQRLADKLYELKMIEMDQRAVELGKAEEECRKAINKATKNYNDALLREQLLKKENERRREEEDKRAELSNNIYGDFLTENPLVAVSAFGGHRVVPDRWKGMTPEQVADIKRLQELQILEAKRRRDEERRTQEEEDRQRLNQSKVATLMERDVERKRKEMMKMLADENLKLAREQRSMQQYLNKDLYTNEPTAEFFKQFNTSTR
ncbi:hypothetical protein HELRODRAFT_90340 [Helobdella robusta]|uniref:RIB43A-like with coiled-coils protein 2 n=1 Tax=Helobdella robusta TaxID=6412 RepID=T1G7P4_HELRO|nr:hypothetical protein HELRODRAFT_90340 [Helobdella robusta]ESN91169.1 hypothetical protein HELRODRAFT_90340 [Helobdella robusta]